MPEAAVVLQLVSLAAELIQDIMAAIRDAKTHDDAALLLKRFSAIRSAVLAQDLADAERVLDERFAVGKTDPVPGAQGGHSP